MLLAAGTSHSTALWYLATALVHCLLVLYPQCTCFLTSHSRLGLHAVTDQGYYCRLPQLYREDLATQPSNDLNARLTALLNAHQRALRVCSALGGICEQHAMGLLLSSSRICEDIEHEQKQNNWQVCCAVNECLLLLFRLLVAPLLLLVLLLSVVLPQVSCVCNQSSHRCQAPSRVAVVIACSCGCVSAAGGDAALGTNSVCSP